MQPKILLWSAQNAITRDFRYVCEIHYQPKELKLGKRTATAKIYVPNQGWSAAFIETDFADGLRASASIFIYPDSYPVRIRKIVN